MIENRILGKYKKKMEVVRKERDFRVFKDKKERLFEKDQKYFRVVEEVNSYT